MAMFARRPAVRSGLAPDGFGAGLPGLGLLRAEAILLGLLVALFAACVAAATWRAQAVLWPAFAPAILICFALVGIGVYLRTVKQAPRLGLGVVGFAIFMAFTGTVSILAYTFFPFVNPRIDLQLMELDAKVGFVWLDFVTWIASVPGLGLVLSYVYVSSLFQMVMVILLLAYLNLPTQLHRFLLTGILSMLVTLAIWWRWPSIGPPAYVDIPPDLAARTALIANEAVGASLLRWANEGNRIITPDIITGTVSFPSFHLIMAMLVVWFTWRTVVTVPAVIVNTAMVPALILHGGHHLIDLAGGVATFAVCLALAYRLVPRPVSGSG